MLREAKRPLAAPLTGDIDIYVGRYTADRFNHWVNYRGAAGKPAVTVRAAGWNGARSYIDPAELRQMANELLEAATWLDNQITEGRP